MCTLSVIPLGDPLDGFRVVCNRDESRERPEALPPRRSVIGSRGVIAPIDPAGGGTWIAASEAGTVLALLNLNRPGTRWPQPPDGVRSRGLVIPGIVGAGRVGAVMKRLEGLGLGCYWPFRLVGIELDDGNRGRGLVVAEACWDGRTLGVTWHRSGPLCFVSSGLGDRVVAPRLDLFETMVVARGCSDVEQDAFHGHAWPDRPEISVMMSRSEARTVSVTTVEVLGGKPEPRVAMTYEPVGERLEAIR